MLLHYNTGLVRHFVWRCKRMGTDCQVGELMLAGEEALYKAAIKWDPTRGTRFSTFAFQRVNRAIVGYLMEHEDIIKIPVNLKELQSKIRGAQAKLSQVNKSSFRRPKDRPKSVCRFVVCWALLWRKSYVNARCTVPGACCFEGLSSVVCWCPVALLCPPYHVV